MRKYNLIIIFFLIFVIPITLYRIQIPESKQHIQEQTETPSVVNQLYMVNVIEGDIISEMDLDSYVLGVLLGEVPAEFELEALKAQAVASRTYTLRRIHYQSKHENGDICTDSTCCQAYISEQIYLESGGSNENLDKMQDAIALTSGQVLTYQGELAEAHSPAS